MATLALINELTRIGSSNAQEAGGLPVERTTITTTSSLRHQSSQVIGTSHEAIAAGDAATTALVILKNDHATAIVEVGNVVSAVFYPIFTIPPGEKAQLPRVANLANLYMKSDTVSTPVIVTSHIVAA